eukprot:9367-Heterococcus_DN1.PRE.2
MALRAHCQQTRKFREEKEQRQREDSEARLRRAEKCCAQHDVVAVLLSTVDVCNALELAERVAAEAAELAAKGADAVNAERAALPPLSADTDVLMDSDGEGASAAAGDGSGVSAAAAARAVVTQEQLDAVNVQRQEGVRTSSTYLAGLRGELEQEQAEWKADEAARKRRAKERRDERRFNPLLSCSKQKVSNLCDAFTAAHGATLTMRNSSAIRCTAAATTRGTAVGLSAY